MQHFYVEDSNLPVASLAQSGIARLSDSVPSGSLTEAATIHVASKAFYPAEFSNNLAVSGSNFVSTAVFPAAAQGSNTVILVRPGSPCWRASNTVQALAIQSDWASNVAVLSSNLSSGSSNNLFPGRHCHYQGSRCPVHCRCRPRSSLLCGTAQQCSDGVTAAGATCTAAAMYANSLAGTAQATALATKPC